MSDVEAFEAVGGERVVACAGFSGALVLGEVERGILEGAGRGVVCGERFDLFVVASLEDVFEVADERGVKEGTEVLGLDLAAQLDELEDAVCGLDAVLAE